MSVDEEERTLHSGVPPDDEMEEEVLNERQDLLNVVKTRQKELKEDHWLDLDIPGYDGLLVVRCRPYPISKTEGKMAQVRKAVEKNTPFMLSSACDNIVAACEQVMLRKGEGEEPMPIDPEALEDGVPIKFDSRLARLLGFDEKVSSAKEIIIELFPTEQAIVGFSGTLTQWLQDTSRKVNEDLLGE